MLQTEPELRGVMARGIAALPALLDRGYFLKPPSVREAKAAFIVASDAVRSWVDEYCTLDFDAWTAPSGREPGPVAAPKAGTRRNQAPDVCNQPCNSEPRASVWLYATD